MLVFSKEKFIEDMGEKAYPNNKAWVDECDGQPIKCGRYCSKNYWLVEPRWCAWVDDEEVAEIEESKPKKRGRPRKDTK